MHGDEGALRRYLRFELDTLHAGLVTQRRPLLDLRKEPRPSAPARNGTHAFDPRELERLAQALPTELQLALRLPIHLYVDTDAGDAVYVQDAPAAEALASVGFELGSPDPQGRRWCSRARALQVVRDWPTCTQFVYL